MNIRKLNIFYRTAITLNMTTVSKELFISQPSVSQAIREIEEEVGVRLFERIGKKIYLTCEGEVYLSYIRRILNLYSEVNSRINNMSNNGVGRIKIGASTTIGLYILPNLIKKFLEEYKGIEISLVIENTSIIEDLLLENKIDFAYIEGKSISNEIQKKCIWNDEIVFICSNKSDLSNEKIVNSKYIKNNNLLMREYGSGTREIVEGYLVENKIEYNVFMELRENEAVKKYVQAGLGIGCISSLCIEKDEEEKVHIFRLDKGKIERELNFIIHKDKFINNNMREFINFINR